MRQILFTAIAFVAHELGQAAKHYQHRPCETHRVPADRSVLAEQEEDTKPGDEQGDDKVVRTFAHFFVHHKCKVVLLYLYCIKTRPLCHYAFLTLFRTPANGFQSCF